MNRLIIMVVMVLGFIINESCQRAGLLNVFKESANNDKITGLLSGENPFGALINKTEGSTFTAQEKKNLLLDLKCKYGRMNIVVTNFNGASSQYNIFQQAGLAVVLNVSNDPTGSQHPFETDTTAYKILLDSVLNVYQPDVLVIENEETTLQYHSGPLSDYFNLLKAAINVAHAHGVKVTNGGIVTRLLTLLTWKSYIDSGYVNKAKDYAAKAFPPNKLKANGMPKDLPAYDTLLQKGEEMIAAYSQLPLDYVNFHWYEPVRWVGNALERQGVDTVTTITSALQESIACLRNITGKEVMTNEIGQWNDQPGITNAVMTVTTQMNLPYIVWYSGDSDDGKARALQNANSTLRATGTAFKNFIIANY